MPTTSLLGDSNLAPEQQHVTQNPEKASLSGPLTSALSPNRPFPMYSTGRISRPSSNFR